MAARSDSVADHLAGRSGWCVRLWDADGRLLASRSRGYWSAISVGRCDWRARYRRWRGSYAAARPLVLPVSWPHRCPAVQRCLLTDPQRLRPKETILLEKVTAACPETTELATLVG